MAARLSARSILLQLPRSWSTEVFQTRICSAGLPPISCRTPGVRTLSGVGILSGVRTPPGFGSWSNVGVKCGTRSLSGGGAERGSGWSAGLWDAAPVHLCEEVLVGLQQASGFPWWLNIVASTVLVRTVVTLPLAAYQMVILGRVEALQAEISELARRLRYEVSVRAREKNWTENHSRFQFKKNLRRIISQLYIRDNCHPFKASVLIWVQLPLWISISLALRNLSLDLSDLTAGGALWFCDLSVPDPTWILPVLLGLTNLLAVEVFSLQRLSEPTRLQRIMTNGVRTFSLLMVPIAASVPASMALYWFCSSLVGLGHQLLLRSPSVHQLLRLPGQRSQNPYRDLLAALVHRLTRRPGK